MNTLFEKHKSCWTHKTFSSYALIGILFFLVSLIINYFTVIYATEHQSNYVTDIILDHTPTVDVNTIMTEGALLLIIFVITLVLVEPQRIPFILKSNALFILIRAIFITLTCIGPFPVHSIIKTNTFLKAISIDGVADLFFSGHTGMPFLMALIFWDDKKLRISFLITSFLFAVSVLLGHLYYSIDVFGAYFITYTIFHMTKTFFSKDYLVFNHGMMNVSPQKSKQVVHA